jgi:hypothetical protein
MRKLWESLQRYFAQECEGPKRTKPFLPNLYRPVARTVGKRPWFRRKASKIPSRRPLEARDPLKPNRKYYLCFVPSGPRYKNALGNERRSRFFRLTGGIGKCKNKSEVFIITIPDEEHRFCEVCDFEIPIPVVKEYINSAAHEILANAKDMFCRGQPGLTWCVRFQ